MRKLTLLEWLYLIPIVGLVIAIVWCIVDIEYVNSDRMNPHVMFYGGMVCHILVSTVLTCIILPKLA